ncbi:MAG: glycosyltransferase family 1 protein, partial [Cyanobacteria bacterium P01_H01_bin.15]
MPPSESTSKLEIAVFCPYFLGGGAEAVCLWILQALIERYSVTLYTLTGLDLVKMNRMYDTNLPTEKLKVVSLFSRKWELIIYSLMANNTACKNFFVHLIIKRIKQECHNYAACFSAFNAVDMGRPSLQYLHYIGVIDNKTQFYKLSDFSEARLRENTSLANSGYVAKLAEAEYGSPAAVVY